MNLDMYSNPQENPPPPDQTPPEEPQPRPQVQVQISLPAKIPYITYALIAINVLIYILQVLTQSSSGTDILTLYGAKINQAIYQGQYWRFFTPMFLHGSILHIAFNMYALYVIGPGLERYYGHLHYTILYFIGGFAGNVASFLFTPAVSLGSSTAIFGLIAAEVIFIYRNRFLFGNRSRSLLINLIFIIAFNLFLGFSPGIDNNGHLGGLVGGITFAWFAGPIMKVSREANGFLVKNQRPESAIWITALLEVIVLATLITYGFYRHFSA
jgi:rhomboid protease GluP